MPGTSEQAHHDDRKTYTDKEDMGKNRYSQRHLLGSYLRLAKPGKCEAGGGSEDGHYGSLYCVQDIKRN